MTPTERQRRLGASLRYTLQTLHWLNGSPENWDSPVSNHAGVCLLEKVHSEAALLALLAMRGAINAAPSIVVSINEIATALGQEATVRRAVERLMRLPHLSPAFALPVLLRQACGLAEAAEIRLLYRSLEHPLVDGIERFPFRRLDVAWVKHACGLPSRLDDAQLLLSTCLAHPVHPVYASLTDLYALTHVMFHHADYGRRPLNGQLFDLAALAGHVRAAAAFALVEGDLDLLAELVCCAQLLPELPPWARSAWQLVCEAWDQYGFVPSRDFEISLLASAAEAPQKRSYVMRSTYHPTLVAGLMSLMPSRQLSPERGELADSKEAVALALRVLEHDSGSRGPMAPRLLTAAMKAWEEGAALGPLLCEAALISACRRYDLDAVLDLLEAPLSVHSVTLTCVLDFLLRQEVDHGMYGAHFLRPENRQSAIGQMVRTSTAQRVRAIELRFDSAPRAI